MYEAGNLDVFSMQPPSHHLNIPAHQRDSTGDLILTSLHSLWSDLSDQWLLATLGPVGRPWKATDTLSGSRQIELGLFSVIYKVIM